MGRHERGQLEAGDRGRRRGGRMPAPDARHAISLPELPPHRVRQRGRGGLPGTGRGWRARLYPHPALQNGSAFDLNPMVLALPYFLESARGLELIGVLFWIWMIYECATRERNSTEK